jgi:hypothetical protein
MPLTTQSVTTCFIKVLQGSDVKRVRRVAALRVRPGIERQSGVLLISAILSALH